MCCALGWDSVPFGDSSKQLRLVPGLLEGIFLPVGWLLQLLQSEGAHAKDCTHNSERDSGIKMFYFVDCSCPTLQDNPPDRLKKLPRRKDISQPHPIRNDIVP